MKKCPKCGKVYYGEDFYCHRDNQRLVECENEYCVPNYSQEKEVRNIPRCPTCQSTKIKKISALNRGTSVALLGLFSSKIGKSFECENCGYKW